MTDPLSESLYELLRRVGAPADEVERAGRDGPQALLALFAERALVPGHERLTRDEVAARAGIDVEQATAFWRALGFAEVPLHEADFTELDVEMLRRVAEIISSGIVEPELALQTARVMGRAAAQIAAALIDTTRRSLEESLAESPPPVLAQTPALLADLERWLGYILRRHLAAEAKRAALQAVSQEAGSAVVGFADLVGFAGISQQLDEPTLAAAVSSFESTAVEVVGRRGGRVVKMIGDEVMFEAPTPRDGALIALDLIEAFASDNRLPDVRVGLASGPVTRNQGDLFGIAPNLASRLVGEAYPASVLVSEGIADAVADEPGIELKSVRARSLKGFGRTKIWVVRREGAEQTQPAWKVLLANPLRAAISEVTGAERD